MPRPLPVPASQQEPSLSEFDLSLFRVEDEEAFFEKQLRRSTISLQAPPTSEEPLGSKVTSGRSQLPHLLSSHCLHFPDTRVGLSSGGGVASDC